MSWFHKRRKETATTVMMETERTKNLLFLSALPNKVDCIFEDIAKIKSMLKQIMKALEFTSGKNK